MALNWDVKENTNAYREISKEEYEKDIEKQSFFHCPKYEEDGKYYQMNMECNMLILICGLSIGIPEINEENYEQVFNRITIMEDCQGTFLRGTNPKTNKSEPYPFTLEMVKNNIGIKTNGLKLTRSEFQKKVVDSLIGDKEI
jgi:hypothetical protein